MEYLKLLGKLNYVCKKYNYQEFTKFIQNRFLLKKTKEFLHYLNCQDIKPQIFLTVYLINTHPTEIINTNQYKDEVLFTISKEIIKNINYFRKDVTLKNQTHLSNETIESTNNKENNLDNIKQLITKMLHLFHNKFKKWKQNDKISQLEYYAKSYYELEEILKKTNDNKTTHEIYILEIKRIQSNLKDIIIKLDKNNGLQYLKDYQNKFQELIELEKKILIKKLRATMKEAFWNRLKLDLEKKPPVLTQIPSILKDINMGLKALVSLNQKYKKHIDEIINYEFLKQLIEKNLFNYTQIYNLSTNMLTIVKELGMQEDDEYIDELINWVKSSFQSEESFVISTYLPKLFKSILDIIEKIQSRIIQLKKLL